MTLDERKANEVMEKKLRCVNLLLSCPLNRDAPGCPFGKVRHEESVVTRVNWLKSQSSAKITEMLDRHATCTSRLVERARQ